MRLLPGGRRCGRDADGSRAPHSGGAWRNDRRRESLDGKLDDAYEHLARARRHYDTAGELSPRVARHRALIPVSCDTDEAFLDVLCHRCRELWHGEDGASLRRHLRNALELLPTDLPGLRACCDGCYGTVWKAVRLARHGFLPDALEAWWLYRHADQGDACAPPSVGRFVAALDQVAEDLQFQNQKDRLAMAERAYAEAEGLDRPLLVTEARLWRGSVERGLAEFDDAREKLRMQDDLCHPWLVALRYRFAGLLEQFTDHRRKALDCFATAAALYKNLDPHLTGVVTFNMGP